MKNLERRHKRQRTDEKVQRVVQHGIFDPHLSTENLLQIPAQSVHIIMGAISIFLMISDI
jgi:hypothetical protein